MLSALVQGEAADLAQAGHMTAAVGLHVEPDDLHQPDFGQLVAEFRLKLKQLGPGQGLGGASDRRPCAQPMTKLGACGSTDALAGSPDRRIAQSRNLIYGEAGGNRSSLVDMDIDTTVWVWIVAGALLMLSETVIPGGVVVFVGIAAVLVGSAQFLGWLEGPFESFTVFFVLSIVLLLSLRGLVSRFFPGDTSYQSPDEDAEAVGSLVDVVETVSEGSTEGRIHFRGTSWPATCVEGSISRGQRAIIVTRDNLIWIVEPAQNALAIDRGEEDEQNSGH